MPVYAELSISTIVVAPGDEEVARLTVRNIGTVTESYAIVPLGLCAGWTLVDPPTLTLFAGEEQAVRVTLRPPRSSSVAAGQTVLTLRVVPHGAPDDAATIEASVTVLAFSQRRISVMQPVQRAHRTAVYDVIVENLGNAQASCRLGLVDPVGRVAGRFDPPSIGIDPGQNASAQVRVNARRHRWTGGTASLPFTVEAAQDGFAPAVASATLLQAPVFNRALALRLGAAAIGALALIAGWVFAVRPAIDDAAKDAVAEVLDGSTTDSVVTTPGDSTPTDDTTAPVQSGPTTPTGTPQGEPFTFRLTPTAALGTTGKQAFAVPAGQRLLLTDIVLQNANGDLGTVTLVRGDEVLLVWNLANVLGDDLKQYVTPIVVTSDQELRLEVQCSGAGDPAAGVCAPAASFSGRIVSD